MVFDVDPPWHGDAGNEKEQIELFVANLLTDALTITFESLEEDSEGFIDFLNRTCALRLLPLGDFDVSKPSTFCMFVNLYHCLLQHALLLTVNGPVHKVCSTKARTTTDRLLTFPIALLCAFHADNVLRSGWRCLLPC